MTQFKATCVVLFMLCWQMCTVAAASFTASVDRVQLNAGESVELILETDDTSQFLTPDLSPLKPFFELLSSKQVNRLSTAAGTAKPVTQWILTLLPKQSGFVIIPALTLGQLQSTPLNLHINEQHEQANAPVEPVYIDTQLDHDAVYVQAQLLLTLRIYHAIPLFADSNLTPLLLDNARVEQLGQPRTFEQHINGVRHGVIEIKYAIFPQQSGQLQIPAQVFSATLAGHNPQSLTPFRAEPGQRIEVKSAQIPLQVKDIPSTYPTDAAWLPARALRLEHSWTPSLDSHLNVGSAATRLLSVHAQGLPSSQLPTLDINNSNAYKVYRDKPSFSHQYTEQGLDSSRSERQAFIFQEAGLVQLDAIQLPWWNTQTDQLEYAQLNEQRVLIHAAPALAQPLHLTELNQEADALLLQPTQLWFWQVLSACLAVLSLLGFSLWWRARHQPAVVLAQNSGPSPRSLSDDLKRACLSNNPQSTRQALDAWARQYPESLVDMAARDSTLSHALDHLNSALYSENDSEWQGEELWSAIRQLSFTETPTANTDDQLPPLYPP